MKQNTPIAVIGMSCIFPKSPGLKEYWRLLFHGQDAITDTPETHWSPEDYFHEDQKKPDHVYCKRGGFISPVSFDPSEFGIPPSSLEATDTSQLMGLVAAKMALEDAGWEQDKNFDRDRTSVILGVTGTQELVIPLSSRLGHPMWRKALKDSGVEPEKAEKVVRHISDSYVPWQENSFPGLLGNVVAGRICNRLDLGGTNCVVDAACASSMAALHLALMELETGRSDMVVSGGADMLNDIFMHMCFSKTFTLSSTGDARPFSKDADGTVLGEGIGMFVLKRLEDAEKDGNRIYAVIKGMGTSSDGKSQSIYAPNSDGQAKALCMAYKRAGIDPCTVELMEAHGTGTRVGDKVEFQTIKSVFSESRSQASEVFKQTSEQTSEVSKTSEVPEVSEGFGIQCALGSVKSMIGHTKAAAGAAGLIKIVLSLYHKVFLPTIKADEPDPDLNIDESFFYLNTETRPWFSRKEHPRRAASSSFGFGGSNFHVVAEEYQKKKQEVSWDGSVQISEHLKEKSEKLPGKIAFIFPGQGSQYVSMGRDLVCNFPEAFEVMEKANEKWSELRAQLQGTDKGQHTRISDFIYPHPVRTKEQKATQEETLRKTDIAQPAIGAVSAAMLNILKRFGIRPDATCGHSFGELPALYAAGWIDIDTFLDLSIARGWFMGLSGQGKDAGTMMAVRAPLEELDAMIKHEGLDVILANRNSPNQGVLSGSAEAVAMAEKVCKQKKFRTIKLPVAAAFHSTLVKDAQEPFMQTLKKTDIAPSNIPVYSNTTGNAYPADPDKARQILGGQILHPVNFVREIENMFDSGVRTFLETGPKSVLTDLVKAILKGRDFHAISLDSSSGKKFGTDDLAKTLCVLDALGYPVELDKWESPVSEKRKQRMSVLISGANYRSENKKRGSVSSDGSYVPKSPNDLSSPDSPGGSGGSCNPGLKTETLGHKAASCQQKQTLHEEKAQGKGIMQLNNKKKPVIGSRESGISCLSSAPLVRENHIVENRKNMNINNQKQFVEPYLDQGCAEQMHGKYVATDALKVVQDGLRSMQSLQMQTTEAHKKFLETQTEASRTLQKMMESTQRLAEVSMGLNVPVYSNAQHLGSGTENTAPEPALNTGSYDMPTPEIPQSSSPPVIQTPDFPGIDTKHSETPEPVKILKDSIEKTTDTSHSSLLTPHLLDVVSELTGYPVEMLSPDMDIEADLGIDSIKRVEILSAMEEKMPGLPPVSPEIMGTLKTLGQIAEYLGENTQQQSAVSSHQPATGNRQPATSNQVSSQLLDVVSELTGYPVEMLSPDMDIEADLGIDSIKRVEILSAMEEKMPGLPPVSPEIMGTLKTLGQIAEYLGENTQQQSAVINQQPATSNQQPATSNQQSATSNQQPAISNQVSSQLLDVVSELTGYPVEMLSPDMDIEADLGIDSIKRVEILSAMEEKMPGLPPVSPEIMGTLKTLGQIAEYLGESTEQPAVGSQQSAFGSQQPTTSNQQPATSNQQLVSRKVVYIVEEPFKQGKRVSVPPGRKIFVTEDKTGLGQAIVDEFTSVRTDAMLVSSDALKNRNDLPPAAGLVILPNPDIENQNPELGQVSGFKFLKDAFAITHNFGPDILASAEKGGAIFATISRLDGAFGFKGRGMANPLQGGFSGLAKTASVEWENVCCHAIDIAPEWKENKKIAKAVVAELVTPGPVEIGLDQGSRFIFALESSPYPQGKINLSQGDVVVVTGGARGVTASAAHALAEHVQPTLVLIGRSPCPSPEPEWLVSLEDEAVVKKAILENEFSGNNVSPAQLEKTFKKFMANREISANLEKIRSAGATVLYYSADVRDSHSIKSVLDDVRLAHGPIKGIIHGAGMLEDRLIIDKTPEQFERVFDTKVRGLNALFEATEQDDLSHIVLFSSVAARMGNKGQADYAMANEVLNKIAQQESVKRPDCRVVSINWGPWDGGMVSPALKREFTRNGIGLIPMDAGAISMVREMMGDKNSPPEVVIGAEIVPSYVPMATSQQPATSSQQPATSNQQPATSQELSLSFKRQLDIGTYPILESHVLDGKPVVPFALIAEWLGHGALHENPGLILHGLDDIRILNGIRLDQEKKLIRLLAGKARKKGQVFEVDVEIRDGIGEDMELVHSKAKAILAETLSQAPLFSMPADTDSAPYSKTMDEVYEKILFHGFELRGIKEITSLSSQSMTARLSSAPLPEKWMAEPLRSKWIGDPLILDSAFQMAIIWCFENTGIVCLPSYSASYRQYRGRFPSEGVTAVLEVRDVTNYKMKGDFTFLDSDNMVVARVDGYEGVMDASLYKAFNKPGYDTQVSQVSI